MQATLDQATFDFRPIAGRYQARLVALLPKDGSVSWRRLLQTLILYDISVRPYYTLWIRNVWDTVKSEEADMYTRRSVEYEDEENHPLMLLHLVQPLYKIASHEDKQAAYNLINTPFGTGPTIFQSITQLSKFSTDRFRGLVAIAGFENLLPVIIPWIKRNIEIFFGEEEIGSVDYLRVHEDDSEFVEDAFEALTAEADHLYNGGEGLPIDAILQMTEETMFLIEKYILGIFTAAFGGPTSKGTYSQDL